MFRTNTAYARWNEARTAWSKIEIHAVNIARCGLAYLETHEKEEHVRRVLVRACMHVCMRTCIHTYMHAYMHTYMHACMHTYMHAYGHTYMVIYISFV